jgi:flagellar assembly protein FliH
MSNILKINKNGKLNVKVRGVDGESYSVNSNSEEQMQLQIHNAYERGYSEGYKKAVNELEKKFDDGLKTKYDELNNLMMSVEEKLIAYDDSFDKVVCELAFVVAEKIVRDSVERHSAINELLSESMKKVLGANNVIIKLNSSDLNNLNNESKSLLNDVSYSKIKFEADDTIEAGGCLIETDIGNVDARISTQIKELKKIIDQKVLINGSENAD